MLADTICAISTAVKDGAINIVRMSGPDAFAIIRKISDVRDIQGNHIIYSHIYDRGEMVDEVLISFFLAGHSYTREDMVEINCHGGSYVTRKIFALLLENGCRMAERGEFTKRAYLNGRIDLAEADSVNDLIKARDPLQARSAIRGLNGSVERLLLPLMEQMKDVIAMIEVNIDYPEYEDEKQMSNEVIKPYLKEWLSECTEMIDKAQRFLNIKDGIKTVIIGKPNVGKSSLLNALLEKDKAIVTDIAGTTRDLIEGKAVLENVTLDLIDTAGIRDTDELIEKIGIEKTYAAIEEADLIILVLDATDIDEQDEELLERYRDRDPLIVYNKTDLQEADGLSIAAARHQISQLVDHLNERYKDDIGLVDQDILNNERQVALMKRCRSELQTMFADIDGLPLDVVATSLHEAYHYLCQILGKEYQEDLIDHMFANFCLGK